MSSTIRAYAATGALTVRGSVESQYKELCDQLESKLAGKSAQSGDDSDSPRTLPLLVQDSFQFMVEATMVLSPIRRLEPHHVLRLSLTIELLRVTLAFTVDSNAFMRTSQELIRENSGPIDASTPTQEQLRSIEHVVSWIDDSFIRTYKDDPSDEDHFQKLSREMSTHKATALFKLCKVYALAFLRKAAIYFHVAHGVDFPTTAGTEATLSELERLCHLLQLPSISDILMSFGEYSAASTLKARAKIWLGDCLPKWFQMTPKRGRPEGDSHVRPFGIRLLHPAPFELIGLPQYFDVLMEESHRRKCPTTGKEVSDPALCLFCGEIFCSQTVCCLTKDMRGGCNAHLEKCSSPIGMFLFIRKCHVALLHVAKVPKTGDDGREEGRRLRLAPSSATLSHGSFFPAPYLTKHGETDSGLRSKHQLILNQKRYDKLLRDTWLMTNGSVWSTISRKLESEVNAGGWETL